MKWIGNCELKKSQVLIRNLIYQIISYLFAGIYIQRLFFSPSTHTFHLTCLGKMAYGRLWQTDDAWKWNQITFVMIPEIIHSPAVDESVLRASLLLWKGMEGVWILLMVAKYFELVHTGVGSEPRHFFSALIRWINGWTADGRRMNGRWRDG